MLLSSPFKVPYLTGYAEISVNWSCPFVELFNSIFISVHPEGECSPHPEGECSPSGCTLMNMNWCEWFCFSWLTNYNRRIIHIIFKLDPVQMGVGGLHR